MMYSKSVKACVPTKSYHSGLQRALGMSRSSLRRKGGKGFTVVTVLRSQRHLNISPHLFRSVSKRTLLGNICASSRVTQVQVSSITAPSLPLPLAPPVMAGLILYGITWSVSTLHNTLQNKRSVALPSPVEDDAATGITDCFTFRDLKALHRQWQSRVLM